MHEVVYFDTPGFAEVSRFCLGISGLEWKNTIVNWDGYLEMKNKGELPPYPPRDIKFKDTS